jgi:S1-C subfamily serine protease
MRRLLIPAAVLAAVTTGCAVTIGSHASSVGASSIPSPPPLPSTNEPVEAVVARVLPAVVNVTTNIFQPNGVGGAQQGRGVGTGFVVRSDGVIVTNCHVVEDATKITVSSSAKQPQQFAAHVIGGDCKHDLAVLKIGASNLTTVPLGSSGALQLGQRVVAIGYALALEGGPTVTAGIVSSLNRTIQVQDPNCQTCKDGLRTYGDVIQTDAAINHGNSGGPLVNMQGQVVGINSAGDSQAENIGFAIAIDSAKSTIAQAEKSPLAPSGYIGVSSETVTASVAQAFGLSVTQGAYVLATVSGGPADAAGIKQGDVIVAVNGQTVTSAEDLGKVLSALHPGQRATVEVVHPGGAHQSFSMTLGTRPLPVQLP